LVSGLGKLNKGPADEIALTRGSRQNNISFNRTQRLGGGGSGGGTNWKVLR